MDDVKDDKTTTPHAILESMSGELAKLSKSTDKYRMLDEKAGLIRVHSPHDTRKQSWKRIVTHMSVVVFVILAGLLAFKMLPKRAKYCSDNMLCSDYEASKANPNHAMDKSDVEYPVRPNIHKRHKRYSTAATDEESTGEEMDRNSFLHRMLPSNYISRIPAPEGAIEEPGLQFPWQTMSRWVYPAKKKDGEDGVSDPNDHTGGVPEVANEECLKRCDISWWQKKGTKVYLKVHSIWTNLT